jgi:cytochrome c peroxidase
LLKSPLGARRSKDFCRFRPATYLSSNLMQIPVFRDSRFRPWLSALLLTAAVGLTACGGSGAGNVSPAGGGDSALSAQAALGEKIFRDTSLSASGQQACISCHAPTTGHASPNDLPAQLGGANLDQQGGRTSPGIRYLAFNKGFRFEADGTPTGGFFWDGRAGSLQDQAARPFLAPKEMANPSVDALVQRLSRASYANELKTMFGPDIFQRPMDALARVALLLQSYQLEAAEFKPFTSKYDEFLRGYVPLSAQEQRGLSLFNDESKGNCAACHPSTKGADGSLPLFTDFTYDNLGVPRNPKLQQNADPKYFDLGLCARDNGDLTKRTDLCGKFRVPSLRNVALRKVYFHNGRFTSLKDVVSFYVTRDTNAKLWYPLNADGTLNKFDDLPDTYKRNVNVTEGPYNRLPGQGPALNSAEIDDLLAFLGTLSDGYKP